MAGLLRYATLQLRGKEPITLDGEGNAGGDKALKIPWTYPGNMFLNIDRHFQVYDILFS
jgi:hypothetical protein